MTVHKKTGRPLGTHCVNGHLWTQETSYLKGKNARQCRLCWATRRTREREERRADTSPDAPALDPKQLARLRSDYADGIPEYELAPRFGLNHQEFLEAVRGVKRAA